MTRIQKLIEDNLKQFANAKCYKRFGRMLGATSLLFIGLISTLKELKERNYAILLWIDINVLILLALITALIAVALYLTGFFLFWKIKKKQMKHF